MSVKIRLSRHGKKNHAFFHILVTDSRAPRDGRFIEVLGTYNPNTNPATIAVDAERSLYWLNMGAQPSDTCRRILSFKGIMLKKHLQGGVTKGALTQEQADAKYAAWVAEKESKVTTKIGNIAKKADDAKQAAFDAEKKVNDARAEVIAKRKADEAAAKAAEEAAAAKAAAEAAAEKAAEEAAAAKAAEAPVEATAEATAEASAQPAAEEAPKAE